MLLLICCPRRLWNLHILESVQEQSLERSDLGMATAQLCPKFRLDNPWSPFQQTWIFYDSINVYLRTTFTDASFSVQVSSSSLSQSAWPHWCLFTLVHILQKISEIKKKVAIEWFEHRLTLNDMNLGGKPKALKILSFPWGIFFPANTRSLWCKCKTDFI